MEMIATHGPKKKYGHINTFLLSPKHVLNDLVILIVVRYNESRV